MKTSLLVEAHPHSHGHLVRALLRIEGEARDDEQRVPLNLSLVLDRSGSMCGDKLEAVKRAARDLIQRLHPSDVVSVVAFDDEVRTVAEPGTADDQAGLTHALMGIECGSTTNLSGGWLQGRALVQQHHQAEGVNRLVLLTDGLANVGITDPETLRRLCAQALESRVTTTTVGVGEGFDEDLLAGMADAGGGTSYYIERLDQAGGVFEEELEGLLSIAAQNLTVSIRPRDAVAVATVHHSYPADAGPDRTLRLSVGDLYAREPREVLADFLVSPERVAGAEPGETELPVVDLVVEADVWKEDGAMERQKVSLPVTFEPGKGAVSHPEVTKVFTLLEAARARREAVERGDQGDVGGAALSLRAVARVMAAAAPDDPEVREEVEDLERMADTLEAQDAMHSMDRKYMAAKQRLYSTSRRSSGDRLSRG
ncbi:MAG: VWA domain-containing protein [Gemmatimonadales bacterium]|nr:MAG: VWA domain-containing protein [Gemmatimonadales bacterium]